MDTNHFGKTKFFNLVKDLGLLNGENCKMKNFEYRKFRRSEWLDFQHLHFYLVNGWHLYIDIYDKNLFEKDIKKQIHRIVYAWITDRWVKTYHNQYEN